MVLHGFNVCQIYIAFGLYIHDIVTFNWSSYYSMYGNSPGIAHVCIAQMRHGGGLKSF